MDGEIETDGEAEGEKDGEILGENEVPPPATYSSAPMSQVAPLATPSMSIVKLRGEDSPEVSVPTSINPEPDTKCKFSLPVVTFTKLLVE